MTTIEDTFTLDDFCSDAWLSRPEYASDDIRWPHIEKIHRDSGDLAEIAQCGDLDYWYALHTKNSTSFEIYLYIVGSWTPDFAPRSAHPVMWIYGTSFDGVREISGAQNFTGNLMKLSAALLWVQEYCCRRWPSFAEWYK